MARPNKTEQALPELAGDGAGHVDLDAEYAASAAQTQERLWWTAGVLYRSKWWILALTVIVAAASVYLTLQLPNKYRAETRVLLPEGGSSSLLAGALSNLPAGAAALIGGGGGAGFTRYMAILDSDSTLFPTVDRFDLVRVYETAEEDNPREAALGELKYERLAFDVNLDYDYLGISVLDVSPDRAAQIANYLVERLNERNIEFQASSAAENRQFLERRLNQANADLDSAQAALQILQERSGVIEPTAQVEALFSALAGAQAEVTTAEVAYQALLAQLGPENPETQSARAAVDAARREVDRLSGGGVTGLPGIGIIPQTQRQYAEVMQDLTLQRAIIETVQPLYEQAALEEKRTADAVQVLDRARPPSKKAEPRRSILVVAATMSAFLVAVAMSLLVALLRRSGPSVLAKLRTA
ncbi:MAG: Wzz/FepE/Etk N-terminal domain-containing protein [Bacteroidota bacterium]